MYIDERDTFVSNGEDAFFRKDMLSDDALLSSDPMDSLIEDLRGEFKRQLIRQTQEREAARRKRLVALTCVIAPVGLMMAAAVIGRAAANPKSEAGRQETHYGRR